MPGCKKLSDVPSSLAAECSSFEASIKRNSIAMVERESSPNKRQQCIKDNEIEILEVLDDHNTNKKNDVINTMTDLSMNLNNGSKSVLQQPGPIEATSTGSTTTFSFKTSRPKPVFGNTGASALNPEILFEQPAKQKVGLYGSSFGRASSLSPVTFVFDSQNNQKTIPFGAKPTDFVSVNTATFNPFSFSNNKSGGFFQSAFSNYRETNRSTSGQLSKNTNIVGTKNKKEKRKLTQPSNHLVNRVAEDLTLRVLRTETVAENNPYHKRMRMDTPSSPEKLISLNVNTNKSEAHAVKKTVTYKFKNQRQTNLNLDTNKDKRKTFTSNGEKLDSGLVQLQNSVVNDTTLNNSTRMNSKKVTNSNKTAHAGSGVLLNKNNVVAKEREVLSSVPKSSRHLRPVIIDGSNLATEHGKAMNSYSCKGIEISIKYFLRMGHRVTAFVPNSIRYKQTDGQRISDVSIIEKLAKDQHVVFTPSRRFVGGNTVVCDERRYVVELAAKDGGVILSNHQFEDLKEESYSFKVAIEERLLMYCFVGDILMIPHDPMGRYGPFLEEFLSFPIKKES